MLIGGKADCFFEAKGRPMELKDYGDTLTARRAVAPSFNPVRIYCDLQNLKFHCCGKNLKEREEEKGKRRFNNIKFELRTKYSSVVSSIQTL